MRLNPIEGHWYMKPMTDEEGNTVEEFFCCVDTIFYKESDYTIVTDEYKTEYERQHQPEEEETEAPEEFIIPEEPVAPEEN